MKKLSIVFKDSNETRGLPSTPPPSSTPATGAGSPSTNPPSTSSK